VARPGTCIDSLQSFRDTRQRRREPPGDYRVAAEDADIAPESLGNPIRELADRLVEEASKAAEFRVRLELSEQAESTLREELADERRRREEAEREREDLRRDLDALRGARQSPESPGPTKEVPTPEYPHGATERPEGQESARPRSLWSRMFGS
jgi:chromosome segregation ATPase